MENRKQLLPRNRCIFTIKEYIIIELRRFAQYLEPCDISTDDRLILTTGD